MADFFKFFDLFRISELYEINHDHQRFAMLKSLFETSLPSRPGVDFDRIGYPISIKRAHYAYHYKPPGIFRPPHCVDTRTFPRNQDVSVKLKSELIFIKFWYFFNLLADPLKN